MINDIKKDAQTRMQKCVEVLKTDLTKLRTGRATTAIVDHRGRVSQALPFHRPGALVGRFDGRTGLTPYAWWASRLGLWPLVAGATLVCLWAAAGAAAARSRGCPPP